MIAEFYVKNSPNPMLLNSNNINPVLSLILQHKSLALFKIKNVLITNKL